ncbi:hypothetical protein L218DRAFT_948231 [Marasmius fiardii PR-910]|nr:hypothetical protein L218DRAFT_948231 [Marasmius fiardii PR-910]
MTNISLTFQHEEITWAEHITPLFQQYRKITVWLQGLSNPPVDLLQQFLEAQTPKMLQFSIECTQTKSNTVTLQHLLRWTALMMYQSHEGFATIKEKQRAKNMVYKEYKAIVLKTTELWIDSLVITNMNTNSCTCVLELQSIICCSYQGNKYHISIPNSIAILALDLIKKDISNTNKAAVRKLLQWCSPEPKLLPYFPVLANSVKDEETLEVLVAWLKVWKNYIQINFY